jgi:hypothetical protein
MSNILRGIETENLGSLFSKRLGDLLYVTGIFAIGWGLSTGLYAQSKDSQIRDGGAPLPIFDAHVHYSHDAAAQIGTDKVIGLMREAGLKRVIVSSSDDEGTQKLFNAAPDLIVPSLRPYRQRGDLSTWTKDPATIPYLEQRLKRYKYAAIGEFHLYGADADSPIPRRMVELSQQYKLILHAHSDSDAIERLFKQAPQATILWAHSGFDRPEAVRAMLKRHPRLFADLAHRTDQASPEWTAVFKEMPDRFVVGTDTFTPERLFYIPEHARVSRDWLKALPASVAEKIGWRNGEALINGFWKMAQVSTCDSVAFSDTWIQGSQVKALLQIPAPDGLQDSSKETVKVSQAFSLKAFICPNLPGASVAAVSVNATMPEHQHGMNYRPRVQLQPTSGSSSAEPRVLLAQGMVFHMPGRWQIEIHVSGSDAQGLPWPKPEVLRYDYLLN